MKIAITGTMGAGKSSVSDYLKSLGFSVLDTDKMVHEYYRKDGKLYTQIIDTFGKDVLANDEIDRKKLASIVFSDKQQLNILEEMVHPVVLKDIQSVDDRNSIIFFEVPQLFESNMEANFDKIIMIDADKDVRIQRLLNRGLSLETIENRLLHQMSGEKKREKSDYIIENNNEITSLYSKVDALLEKLKEG